jgi:hypothetical protein
MTGFLMVEWLLQLSSKHEALSSNLSTAKKPTGFLSFKKLTSIQVHVSFASIYKAGILKIHTCIAAKEQRYKS